MYEIINIHTCLCLCFYLLSAVLPCNKRNNFVDRRLCRRFWEFSIGGIKRNTHRFSKHKVVTLIGPTNIVKTRDECFQFIAMSAAHRPITWVA